MTRSPLLLCLVACVVAGCASSGVVPTSKDTYMISKTSAGGGFVSGVSIKAELVGEAGRFCAGKGQDLQIISTESQDALVASRMPSAQVDFRCTPK